MTAPPTDELHPNEWLNFNSIWDAIKDDPPSSILDIGCGCAIYDALLAQHGVKKFILIDGDGSRHPRKKYGGIDRPWGNVNMGVAYMTRHAPGAHVSAIALNSVDQVRGMNEKFKADVDLVLSIRSWCHHYPAETYAKLAWRSLKYGGRLIVDIRKGRGNFEYLVAHGFELPEQIPSHSTKCDRWMFKRGSWHSLGEGAYT